jgi:cyanophycinase
MNKKKAYMNFRLFTIISCFYLLAACSKQINKKSGSEEVASKTENISAAKVTPPPTVVTYLTGSAADVTTNPTAGLILMGGSTDVDAAIAWFLQRANGGDVVVIRATGADGYNQYMYNMVPVNSVETIIIDSREKASLTLVTDKIKNAEALFIAGGDQSDYVNYWKDTPTETAINDLMNSKHVTVGGTSAGLAVMGAAYYSAQSASVTSKQALSNPYDAGITLGNSDFINAPNMQGTITDSHYTQRDRQGRHITFMARLMKDFGYSSIKGIGIDEQTAVCVDQNGIGKVYGINNAYFLKNTTPGAGAETCISRKPLTWNRGGQAVSAYKIAGSATGNGTFNATSWTFSGGTSYYYYVNNGVLVQN